MAVEGEGSHKVQLLQKLVIYHQRVAQAVKAINKVEFESVLGGITIQIKKLVLKVSGFLYIQLDFFISTLPIKFVTGGEDYPAQDLHMDPESSRTARESLDLAFKMSNFLDTGLDRHTLSVLVALCEHGVNPESLAALVKELRREPSPPPASTHS